MGAAAAVALRGRRLERDELDGVLRDIGRGHSRVLVLRGEPGTGKTALLDYLGGRAGTGTVARTAGVEQEAEIAYAGLQQLCAPFLDQYMDRLPAPQRAALATAFGLESGEPPQPLIVGMAVLGLLAEASAEPLVCIVDDVQWLDRMSEVVLTFVARRLGEEAVALVFAARSPGDERILPGLPELRIAGLPPAEAAALLDSVLPGPVDERVRARIVADTGGNPLAILELPRGMTAAELAFGFGGQSSNPLTSRLERGFEQRVAALPRTSRQLLLAAALEPLGDVTIVWRALEVLGIGTEALAAAEEAGLVEFGARIRFRHPLVRSASWRTADIEDLRATHRAFAAVVDPVEEPDRRAWHRAHATTGPDEEVAGELEASADRAMARGGRVAAAAFLERAAELTADPGSRARRALSAAWARFAAGQLDRVPELLGAVVLSPLSPLHLAEVERLRAQVTRAVAGAAGSVAPLLDAANVLEPLDLRAARETCLAAFDAALHAGRLDPSGLAKVAATARGLPDDDDPSARLLCGLLGGAALNATASSYDPQWVWLVVAVAGDMWDAHARDRLSAGAVRESRRIGALPLLTGALAARAEVVASCGALAEADEILAELEALWPAPTDAVRLGPAVLGAALRGQAELVTALVDTAVREASAQGEGRLLGVAALARAVLNNGLDRHGAALKAAGEAVEFADPGLVGPALLEVIEAATRVGDAEAAERAHARLTTLLSGSATDWAVGTQPWPTRSWIGRRARTRTTASWRRSRGSGRAVLSCGWRELTCSSASGCAG